MSEFYGVEEPKNSVIGAFASQIDHGNKESDIDPKISFASQMTGFPQRSWVRRSFSRMLPGSLRGSTFSMINATIGLGILNLPFRVSQIGVLLSFVFLVFSAVLGTFTLECINLASTQLSHEATFHQITKRYCGTTVDLILKLSMIIGGIGASVINILSASQFISTTFFYVFPNSDLLSSDSSQMILRSILAVGICCFIFFKQITSLRYLSFVSFFLLFYLVLVMLFQVPGYAKSTKIHHEYKWYSFDLSWEGAYNVNAAYTTFTYAFCNQSFIAPLKGELFNPTLRRASKIITRSQVITTIFYALIMYAGYFSMGQESPQLIFNREAIHNNDSLMKTGVFFYALYILICVPIFLFPTKCALAEMVGVSGKGGLQHSLIASGLFIIIVLMATLCSNVTLILNFVGGLVATFVGTTVPGLIFLSHQRRQMKEFKWVGFCAGGLICTLVSLLGFTSSILTVLSIFHSKIYKLEE